MQTAKNVPITLLYSFHFGSLVGLASSPLNLLRQVLLFPCDLSNMPPVLLLFSFKAAAMPSARNKLLRVLAHPLLSRLMLLGQCAA
jgi:hypothetical protein